MTTIITDAEAKAFFEWQEQGEPTLRDQFAIAALPAILQMQTELAKQGITDSPEAAAKSSYQLADAMLKAREE